jgi:hypothetical protein
VATEPEPYLSPKNVVGRGGTATGSALSLLGAALAIIGFLLPWASCAGTPVTGLELAQQPTPTGQSLALIYLVPFLAVGCLGVALVTIPLAVWRRVPLLVGVLAAGLMGVLALGAAVPLVVVYTSLDRARAELERELGFLSGLAGEAITLERGFWITAAGVGLMVAGAVVAGAGALAGMVLPERRG